MALSLSKWSPISLDSIEFRLLDEDNDEAVVILVVVDDVVVGRGEDVGLCEVFVGRTVVVVVTVGFWL